MTASGMLRFEAVVAAIRSTLVAARGQPSFALYLVSLALLPIKWLSPFNHDQAGLTDIVIALAAGVWLVEHRRGLLGMRPRPVHFAYAAFLAAVGASAAFAANGGQSALENLVIAGELLAYAVLTAAFARRPESRRTVARVMLFIVGLTALQAALGLMLFYAGQSTSLVNGYSGYFNGSDLYTRVAAGFYSAPLLGSFCIFASAVLAMDDNGLSKRARSVAQVTLGLLVLLTLSRAAIGFLAAIVIRWGASREDPVSRRRAAGAVFALVVATIVLTVAPMSLNPVRPAGVPNLNPRLETAKRSAETFVEQPLLGAGPGSLTGAVYGQPARAHFTPLNVAATTGILSLIALCIAVALLWGGRRRPTNIAIWAGLAGLAVDGISGDVEHFRHVWILLGLADADRSHERMPRTTSVPGARP